MNSILIKFNVLCPLNISKAHLILDFHVIGLSIYLWFVSPFIDFSVYSWMAYWSLIYLVWGPILVSFLILHVLSIQVVKSGWKGEFLLHKRWIILCMCIPIIGSTCKGDLEPFGMLTRWKLLHIFGMPKTPWGWILDFL